jgi:hypothetical protein
LWFGIERDGADEIGNRIQHLSHDFGDRSVRSEWDAVRPAVAVLRHRLMMMLIQRGDERAGAIWGPQRQSLPTASQAAIGAR